MFIGTLRFAACRPNHRTKMPFRSAQMIIWDPSCHLGRGRDQILQSKLRGASCEYANDDRRLRPCYYRLNLIYSTGLSVLAPSLIQSYSGARDQLLWGVKKKKKRQPFAHTGTCERRRCKPGCSPNSSSCRMSGGPSDKSTRR